MCTFCAFKTGYANSYAASYHQWLQPETQEDAKSAKQAKVTKFAREMYTFSKNFVRRIFKL